MLSRISWPTLCERAAPYRAPSPLPTSLPAACVACHGRLLDPQLATSYPSAILARERAIVVNLEFIKCIIAMGAAHSSSSGCINGRVGRAARPAGLRSHNSVM